MALRPNRQIKSSRPIRVEPDAYIYVFSTMQPETIHPVEDYVRDLIVPGDYPGRSTVALAGSGNGSGYAVEQIISAIEDGQTIHKVYRYTYEPQPDGSFVRRDVTYYSSSQATGQVNDHHQSPKETKARLGGWAGFEHL